MTLNELMACLSYQNIALQQVAAEFGCPSLEHFVTAMCDERTADGLSPGTPQSEVLPWEHRRIQRAVEAKYGMYRDPAKEMQRQMKEASLAFSK